MSYTYARDRGKGRGLPIVSAKPRLFQMVRNVDGKNISGTGTVIDGVVLASGQVVVEWQTKHKSISVFESLNDFLQVHVKPQYEGENEFRWIDGYKPAEDVAQVCDTVEKSILSFDEMKQKHKGALIAILRGIKRKYEEIL